MRSARRPRPGRFPTGPVVIAAVAALVGGLLVPAAGADRLDPIPGLGDDQRDIGVGDFFGDGPEAALIANERAVITFDPLTGLPSVAPIAPTTSGPPLDMDDYAAHAVGDLDGDGFDDIAAIDRNGERGSDGIISWWPGAQDRSFGAGRILDFAPTQEIAVGDFTDDPGDEVVRIDDVGANPSVESSMRVHHPGRRGPVLWVSTDSPEVVWNRFSVTYLLAGDVMPGGRDEVIVIDAVFTGTTRYRVMVFAERGDVWRPEVVITLPAFFDIEEATVGDVDGDGLSDIIVLNDVDFTDELWVLVADGRGGFDDPARVWVGHRDESPRTFYGTADLNRDGLDDLVATASASPVRFFGSATDLLSEEQPVLPPLRCGGRLVTVDLRFGDEPTDGDDVILGTDGPDVIRAGAGADTVCAGGGNDRVVGGPGRDRLVGGPGRDRLVGGPGRDRLVGGPGVDRCIGGPGRDTTRGCP